MKESGPTIRVPKKLAGLLGRVPGFRIVEPEVLVKRQVVHVVGRERSHKAAEVNRFGQRWPATPQSAMDLVIRDQRTLRARARERTENDDYVRRFLAMLDANVIGEDGILAWATTRDEVSQQTDTTANKAIDEAWRDWSENYCDAEGVLTWPEMQSLWLRTMSVDGEVVVRKVYRRDNPYGLSLQLIDPELVPLSMIAKLKNGNYILGGIEFDELNRPVAVYVSSSSPTATTYSFYSKPTLRIPADEISINFLRERIGQRRGLTWFCSGLFRMRMLETYEDAALIAARWGASKMGFIHDDPAHQNPQEYTGEDVDEEGNILTDLEAGSIEELPPGKIFQGFDPGYPRGDFEPFVKAILRGIGAGLNVSYPSFGNDLQGVNYSSIRQGVLDNRDGWKKIQRLAINQLVRPIRRSWIEESILRGAITISGSPLNPARLPKYQAAQYQGRRWAWVDPEKDIRAAVMAIENRLTTRSRVIREQGLDPEELWREAQEEEKKLRDFGLSIPEATTSAAPVEAAEAEPGSEEESGQQNGGEND